MNAPDDQWPEGAQKRLRITFASGLVMGVVLGVIAVIVLISVLTVMISLP